MIKLGLLCVCLEASRYHYTASSGEPTHTQILIAIEQSNTSQKCLTCFYSIILHISIIDKVIVINT